MRTFDSIGSGTCIICKTNNPGKVTLIGIDGTADGNIEEAAVIHVDCIDLRLYSSKEFIYQKIV